ncbi:serine/threonine-protein phosphatase 6 regulatory subunit 3 isoform X2 [Selaginella moellendorffii]|uniref:serine/threonine-protein phosphatase 6 regulatory subunit 3 isoform X2 n=1 Tax=Selaginella moellendorffii TaxID=88036 RepID=UPI000D1D055B|nr:serine/threonine-protein phosphatase 6 regulatory subunit 3 isoform X2 [Selaginella moellendorffii]XP_024540668.1 serine/threonine-protein phosphatase 6 regulatory subunit 3 isoform X2 [Selaginella moellendorffii]|eukprot:XP_024521407.1 serine/threonine-protein phosphatase 6 regulatory subunit 3 isoform X2 [Selaginella moellendorffii]
MAGVFWKMAATSPIESILDKSGYTLEELLDEEQIIQECKSTNYRLVNFLRGKAQVQQMIRYIVEEAPEGASSERAFKFPFISCQVITCEVQDILKTLVEDEELLGFLFSFLDPSWKHGTLLAGYFSKVVICLLIREHAAIIRYLQGHKDLLKNLVDLIGITSIKEVLMRLVEVSDHVIAYHVESLQWLAEETDILEMLVDKLNPQYPSEVHANAAETLAAISRSVPSDHYGNYSGPSALGSKLASPRFVAKLFNLALEDQESKSALIHSLSVCISLLDPKRASSAGLRSRPPAEMPVASPETVEGMLQSLGSLLRLLDIVDDTKRLPTTYGELRPPFGIHRLKIVEFVAVLLRTQSEAARQELIRLQALQTILGFFFDYPFNNMLHTHVEAIITSCIEDGGLTDNLFGDCDFLSRLLATDENQYAHDTRPESVSKKKPPPKVGNMGHLTRIANRLVQTENSNPRLQGYLQSHPRWSQWQSTVLQQRNMLENVFQWTCGRPTSIRERPVESDDEEFRERDFDVSAMATNLTREVFRYGIFDDEDPDEISGPVGREDEDVYFDDESAEVVISSIRLSDEQERAPTWFDFQDVEPDNLTSSAGNSNAQLSALSRSFRDDEVVVGEDSELPSANEPSGWGDRNGVGGTDNAAFNLDYFSRSSADWANFQGYEISDEAIKRDDFGENNPFIVCFDDQSRGVSTTLDGEETKQEAAKDEALGTEAQPDTVVGVEEGATAKAMESALKEGVVGEAGPLKPKEMHLENTVPPEDKQGASEFNDVNYWRSDYENAVAGEQS